MRGDTGAPAAETIPDTINERVSLETAKPTFERRTRSRDSRTIIMFSLRGLEGECDTVADDSGLEDTDLINFFTVGRMITKMVARVMLVAEMNRLASKFFHSSWFSATRTNRGGRPICTPN